jgi:antitoxin (DNA-binding transcriptional repressor) of toxin-antitoxin stability system
MEYIRVRKTDLARNTSQVIRKVLRGQTAVIESHGQPEAALMDIIDFQLQRAAMQYFGNPQQFEKDIEINPAMLDALPRTAAGLPDEQARYDLVLGHYLSLHLSLAKAGNLLGMTTNEIRSRLVRLGIPLRVGPTSVDELRNEIESIENWESNS